MAGLDMEDHVLVDLQAEDTSIRLRDTSELQWNNTQISLQTSGPICSTISTEMVARSTAKSQWTAITSQEPGALCMNRDNDRSL